MIHIFNRSHYEDVVAQKVHKWIDHTTLMQRYSHINDFERLLTESGTVVLKFYLHVSKKTQIKRLEERLQDKAKMWKYNQNDIKEREFWNDYMEAYQAAFEYCSKHTPWHIVPSDHNWYKEYYIAEKVVNALEALDMKYPGLKAE
jgi:polyphosphate kinase 2 (PPK2 family)